MQQGPGNYNVNAQLQQMIAQARAEFQQMLNQQAAYVRTAAQKPAAELDKRLTELSKIAQALIATRHEGAVEWTKATAGGIVRIEDIPGRRVPYTMLVDIPIGNNTTSEQQQSVTISQEGPFVAVRRIATFMSALEFQVTSGSAVSKFSGRSYGRYRPIHSVGDINDAVSSSRFDQSSFFLAGMTGVPALPAPLASFVPTAAPGFPSSVSGFRSMEFDGRIVVLNAGSSYPRQNISCPSTFWAQGISDPYQLAALDFFERGEVLTIKVQPNHVNNPPVGNVDGGAIFGTPGGYPYLAGQYDPHEGIAEPLTLTPNIQSQLSLTSKTLTVGTTDSVVRLPDGILTIGWEGYRIIQPVGPA